MESRNVKFGRGNCAELMLEFFKTCLNGRFFAFYNPFAVFLYLIKCLKFTDYEMDFTLPDWDIATAWHLNLL